MVPFWWGIYRDKHFYDVYFYNVYFYESWVLRHMGLLRRVGFLQRAPLQYSMNPYDVFPYGVYFSNKLDSYDLYTCYDVWASHDVGNYDV